MDSATAAVGAIDLSKTENCVFFTTQFHMGIGRMRQIRDLEVETTADKSFLRHQKQLIDSPELDEIRSQDGYLTRYIASRSCTYHKATRFVAKSEAEKIYRACVAYQEIRRPQLVAAFMREYRKLEVADFAPLREALGDRFDRGDYPESKVVEAGFYFHFHIDPVGQISLSGLPDFIIQQEIAKDRARREQAVIEWKDTLRAAGLEVVDALFNAVKPQTMEEKLGSKRRALKDATVANLKEFLSTFSLRDLAGDVEYQTKVVEPLQRILKGVDSEKMRHSDNLKNHVAEQIADIRKTASLLVSVTGRKFR